MLDHLHLATGGLSVEVLIMVCMAALSDVCESVCSIASDLTKLKSNSLVSVGFFSVDALSGVDVSSFLCCGEPGMLFVIFKSHSFDERSNLVGSQGTTDSSVLFGFGVRLTKGTVVFPERRVDLRFSS
jgi:hypothetical protein